MYHPFKQGMSLKIQIYGLIICISILSFFVRIIIDVDTTRDYLQTQMASHAKDTATSLGLSISPYLDTDGLIIGQTMATAIFDSGYYSKIRFINTKLIRKPYPCRFCASLVYKHCKIKRAYNAI